MSDETNNGPAPIGLNSGFAKSGPAPSMHEVGAALKRKVAEDISAQVAERRQELRDAVVLQQAGVATSVGAFTEEERAAFRGAAGEFRGAVDGAVDGATGEHESLGPRRVGLADGDYRPAWGFVLLELIPREESRIVTPGGVNAASGIDRLRIVAIGGPWWPCNGIQVPFTAAPGDEVLVDPDAIKKGAMRRIPGKEGQPPRFLCDMGRVAAFARPTQEPR